MKITKILSVLFLAVLMSNCEKNEVNNVESVPFNTVSFPRRGPIAEIDPASPTYKLEVNVTHKSSVDRTFTVNLIPLADVPNISADAPRFAEADPADFSIATTTVTVPAGEVKGFLDISFTAENLAIGVTKSIGLEVVVPDDGTQTVYRDRDTMVLNFTQACPDTKAELKINFDNYPEETSWELYLGSDLIGSGGPYDGATEPFVQGLCLAPGDYTFVLYDSYGDGICCASGNGSYSITSNGDTIISGAPTGAQEIKEFTIE